MLVDAAARRRLAEQQRQAQTLLAEIRARERVPLLVDRRGYYIWKHGTTSGYRRGCRCDECTAGHAAYYRRYRERRKERSCRV